MLENRSRRLRAVLRNAVTWGAAWAVAGGALVAGVSLFDPGLATRPLLERIGFALLGGAMWGVRFGIIGAVIGTAFSAIIRVGYRGRRLADISPVKFGLLGAVVGGVGVPLWLQTMNVLTGGAPIAWGLVTDDAIWATLFGGVAAAGSILLARRAERLPPGPRADALERGDERDALPAAEPPASVLVPRERVAQR